MSFVILGVQIPTDKKIRHALTILKGVGYTTSCKICDQLGLSPNCTVQDLSENEQSLISTILRNNFKIENNLTKEVKFNIKKYVENGSIKGFRHRHGLPVRGQRTHSNGRTQKNRKFKYINTKQKNN
jgi:small subunit ribosomal protein S13